MKRVQKIILFDIDGTILLTGGAGKLAFEEVFVRLFGIENAWQEIHPDGRTDPSLIEELFQKNLRRLPTPSELQSVTELYSEAMAKALHAAPNFRLMPGVAELLQEIQDSQGALLGLATGNFETTAYLKLERAGLRHHFSFGGFGSDHPDRLELTRLALERGRAKAGGELSASEVILIGDTCQDIDCGKKLGMTTVAVATGSTPKLELEKSRPDFLFNDFTPSRELRAMLGK